MFSSVSKKAHSCTVLPFDVLHHNYYSLRLNVSSIDGLDCSCELEAAWKFGSFIIGYYANSFTKTQNCIYQELDRKKEENSADLIIFYALFICFLYFCFGDIIHTSFLH